MRVLFGVERRGAATADTKRRRIRRRIVFKLAHGDRSAEGFFCQRRNSTQVDSHGQGDDGASRGRSSACQYRSVRRALRRRERSESLDRYVLTERPAEYMVLRKPLDGAPAGRRDAGVFSVTSTVHLLIKRYLQRNGVDLSKVIFRGLGGSRERLASVMAGQSGEPFCRCLYLSRATSPTQDRRVSKELGQVSLERNHLQKGLGGVQPNDGCKILCEHSTKRRCGCTIQITSTKPSGFLRRCRGRTKRAFGGDCAAPSTRKFSNRQARWASVASCSRLVCGRRHFDKAIQRRFTCRCTALRVCGASAMNFALAPSRAQGQTIPERFEEIVAATRIAWQSNAQAIRGPTEN